MTEEAVDRTDTESANSKTCDGETYCTLQHGYGGRESKVAGSRKAASIKIRIITALPRSKRTVETPLSTLFSFFSWKESFHSRMSVKKEEALFRRNVERRVTDTRFVIPLANKKQQKPSSGGVGAAARMILPQLDVLYMRLLDAPSSARFGAGHSRRMT